MSGVNRRTVLRGAGLGAAVWAAGPFASAVEGEAFATTRAGRVRGAVEDGVSVFRGIPYGEDTAQTRFKAPRAVASWAGVKECVDWAPRAPQLAVDRVGKAAPVGYHLPPDLGVQSEDCLHVNVWTRGLRDGRKRPVLFYIHGGAYNSGTANCVLYDGRRLCRRGDVVVVTVNHRLNAFGHLYLGEIGGEAYRDSGNVGILDLVLALQWVKANVVEFGGDPERVLIFGQSGGGAKCATLMAMPAARGLFQRVLTMSGQQVKAKPARVATEEAKDVLDKLGVKYRNAADLAVLETLPMEKILEAARIYQYWLPVMDGGVLARDPFTPDAPGISASIPMMLGNTHDETSIAAAGMLGGKTGDSAWAGAPGVLKESVGQYLGAYSPEEVVRRYREIYPEMAADRLVVAASVAFRAWAGQVIEADRRGASGRANTWVYRMDWKDPFPGHWSPHTIDLAFLFDNCGVAPGMVGAGPEDLARAQPLAHQMASMLIRFAATGDPNGVGLPRWPAYAVPGRETMIFDETSRVEKDPRGEERVFAAAAQYRQPGT
jgi:para-nitrobenzyl esterase